MRKKGKVASTQAWALTAVAILDLVALVFMSSSNPRIVLLAIFAGCEAVLIVCAVASWKMYFEGLIEEKTRQENSG